MLNVFFTYIFLMNKEFGVEIILFPCFYYFNDGKINNKENKKVDIKIRL